MRRAPAHSARRPRLSWYPPCHRLRSRRAARLGLSDRPRRAPCFLGSERATTHLPWAPTPWPVLTRLPMAGFEVSTEVRGAVGPADSMSCDNATEDLLLCECGRERLGQDSDCSVRLAPGRLFRVDDHPDSPSVLLHYGAPAAIGWSGDGQVGGSKGPGAFEAQQELDPRCWPNRPRHGSVVLTAARA